MRRLAWALVAAAPLLAVLACGGRTDRVVGDDGGCTGTGCSAQCPATFQAGTPCDPATQSVCTIPLPGTTCNGGAISETCSCQASGAGGGTWSCAVPPTPDCPDAEPPVCPAPSSIQPGAACLPAPTTGCPSNVPIVDCTGQIQGYVTCDCEVGSWACIDPGPPECVDATTGCPPPADVQQGVSCSSEGQQCPGRPTECGGQILYDAFQCTGGTWDDIATTICDVDGG